MTFLSVERFPRGRVGILTTYFAQKDRAGMNVPCLLAAAGPRTSEYELVYIWEQATPEAKAIIACLVVFSIVAWSVMISKSHPDAARQDAESLLHRRIPFAEGGARIFDRRIQADGCPMFMDLPGRQSRTGRAAEKSPRTSARKRFVSLKGMEHVKRTMENTVAQESLEIGSGLILLAIAVSGAPFLGLLGTVWGVMSTFGHIAQQGSATMAAIGPRRRRRPYHHRRRIARRHPFHVRLQLAGPQPARPDGRSGQFRAGTRLENGDGVSGRMKKAESRGSRVESRQTLADLLPSTLDLRSSTSPCAASQNAIPW